MTAVAAALLPGAAAAAPARADGGIRLTLNGQAAARIPLDELRGTVDVSGDRAQFTRNDGSSTNLVSFTGTSAAALARIAGVDPAHVRSMEIVRINGAGAVVLSGDEVRNGFAGDPLGHREATFDTNYGPEVHFFRPLRDGSDVNAGDIVDAPRMTDLPVRIATDGAALTVAASAAGARAERRTPVHFTVGVTGAARGRGAAGALGLRRRHAVRRSCRSRGATGSANHTFGTNGLYRATATVTGDDGSSGVGRAQEVRIGKAAGGGAKRDGSHGGGGPNRGSGGGKAQPDSRSTGPAESDGNGGGQAQTGAQTPAPGPATPAPATAQPRDDPARKRSSGGKPRKRAAPPAAAGGEPISGILLASQSVPLDERQLDGMLAQPQSEARAPLRRSAAPATTALGVVAGVGALVALLLAGALRESGRLRTRVRVA